MMRDKTQFALGAALLGAFGAFWRWHSPKAKPLTKEEIDHYLGIAAKLPLPDGEVGPLIERLGHGRKRTTASRSAT